MEKERLLNGVRFRVGSEGYVFGRLALSWREGGLNSRGARGSIAVGRRAETRDAARVIGVAQDAVAWKGEVGHQRGGAWVVLGLKRTSALVRV